MDSPLDLAIDAATMDLKLLAGKSAVIIFSDGVVMPTAVASAQAMKAAMKENICIYTVQIGATIRRVRSCCRRSSMRATAALM